jgi:hypothetical protein
METLALLSDAAFLSKITMGLERRSNPSGARDARFQSGEGISGILLRIRMPTRFPPGHKFNTKGYLSFVGPHKSPNVDTGDLLRFGCQRCSL